MMQRDELWYCRHCGRRNPAEYLYCPACGSGRVGRACPTCGKSVPEDGRFCPWCGEDVIREWRRAQEMQELYGCPAAVKGTESPGARRSVRLLDRE